jgi:hypothetical protein
MANNSINMNKIRPLNGPSPIGDSHAFYDAGIPIVARHTYYSQKFIKQ